MTDHKDAYRARAEAQFRRPEASQTDGAKAVRDAEAAAQDANTERLKRLRLAREESIRHAIETAKAKRQLRRTRPS